MKKFTRIILISIPSIVLSVLGVISLVITFEMFGEPSFVEMKRITSPDSIVDAILVKVNPGAHQVFPIEYILFH